MRIYFYTKKECSLCDNGLANLQLFQQGKKFTIIIRDIYTNDDWLENYQIRIPVVESEEGVVLDEGIVSLESLSKNYEEYMIKTKL